MLDAVARKQCRLVVGTRKVLGVYRSWAGSQRRHCEPIVRAEQEPPAEGVSRPRVWTGIVIPGGEHTVSQGPDLGHRMGVASVAQG